LVSLSPPGHKLRRSNGKSAGARRHDGVRRTTGKRVGPAFEIPGKEPGYFRSGRSSSLLGRALRGILPGAVWKLAARDELACEFLGITGTLPGHGSDRVGNVRQKEVQVLGSFERGVLGHGYSKKMGCETARDERLSRSTT
jgi:hypothetical protein